MQIFWKLIETVYELETNLLAESGVSTPLSSVPLIPSQVAEMSILVEYSKPWYCPILNNL